MPTIITKGQLPGQKRYRATCSNCRTVFEFIHDETKLENSPDPRDAGLRVINCPLHGCSKVIYVNSGMALPAQPQLLFPQGVRGIDHGILIGGGSSSFGSYGPERD